MGGCSRTITTVAFPLSALRMTMFSLSFSDLMAFICAGEGLLLGLGVFLNKLQTLPLISSTSSCESLVWNRASSIPATKSMYGVVFCVGANFRPNLSTSSSCSVS